MKTDFCFSVLALSSKYQILARSLAKNLEDHAHNVPIVIGTDNPDFFRDCTNVSAFHLQKQGILHCYHDKRFVIQEALKISETVVQLDADTQITEPVPSFLAPESGLAGIFIENAVKHMTKYTPERLFHFQKLADKLNIDLSSISFVGESLFSISATYDLGIEFIEQWDLIARYLQLHGIHAGEGNAMGLAAAKVGLQVNKSPWLDSLNQVRQHVNASETKAKRSSIQELKRRLDYHYRLNKARVSALKNYGFYYG